MDIFASIRADERLVRLADMIGQRRETPVIAEGLWGSCAPILAAFAAQRADRPLLLITAHADEADDFRDDIETALGRLPELLPQLENETSLARTSGAAVEEGESADDELLGERLRVCMALLDYQKQREKRASATRTRASSQLPSSSDNEAPVIVAPIYALMQPVPTPEAIANASLTLRVGDCLELDELGAWLASQGFQAADAVEHPGDFSRRGGIFDVFSAALRQPVRIEFFDDEIESIRFFEAGTQRSGETLDSIVIPARNIVAPRGSTPAQQRAHFTGFLAHLPADTIIAINEPADVQEIGRTIHQRLGERAGIMPVDAVLRRASDFTQLHLRRFASSEANAIDFAVQSLPQFEPKAEERCEALREVAESSRVMVLCENLAENQRFSELMEQLPEPIARVESAVGLLHRGFLWGATSSAQPITGTPVSHPNPVRQARGRDRNDESDSANRERPDPPLGAGGSDSVAYIPHHELFHRFRQTRTLRRVAPARAIDSFFDLKVNDYVVHVQHGIARFRGLKALERDEQRGEYLLLEFADKAHVHVPISQIHLVQKYIGSFRGKPKLSKLGGRAWKQTKDKVAESVTDLAAELLALHAQRETQPGIAYPQDTAWQREFEDAFPYNETEDQLRTLAEIKQDMTRPRPMDRLLCGDVGFGKTELAIRAAFKTIEYGKQVAVLVPTTVLAEQHYQTFSDRMADYPFRVEGLSRFRTKKEQTKIVEATKRGEVDVLIGTHRLLSKDVKFADLGLVIIDEEQRFGVTAKEKLKKLRATVDVLTLSATPIPRTLHMSMLGIRDISSLSTPPLDRRAIVTQVRNWNDEMVRAAIHRELNRDGQVYFVHNRVHDINAIANRVRSLVPDARVVVGHGQMSGNELEAVMLTFMKKEADILVATTIIESGIDISTANTMFINEADRYGLADLHQLRGRVGRSKHRAYCYLLLSDKRTVTDQAAKRLKAIEHYSDLGAGFQIAMRDLEIRGAGNILGPEQSGNIEAVGYEMYCQLLEQATRRLKNEDAEPLRPVNLDLHISGSVPRSYIKADRQRMDVYRRLTVCTSLADLETLRDDLRDAFGPIPDDVQRLLDLAEIRVLARGYGIRSIILEPPDVIFAIDDLQRVQPIFSAGPGSPRMPDAKTVHWRLAPRLLEPARLIELLKGQLSGKREETPAIVT